MSKSPRRPAGGSDPVGEFPQDVMTYIFHLFSVMGRHREAVVDEALKPLDLNLSRHRALSVVQRLEPCPMTQLAEYTAIDRTTLTRTVDQLVSAGLVERSTPRTDRRQVLLTLTEKGRATCKLSQSVVMKINRGLVDGLPEGRQREVARAFEHIVGNLVDDVALRDRLLLRDVIED